MFSIKVLCVHVYLKILCTCCCCGWFLFQLNLLFLVFVETAINLYTLMLFLAILLNSLLHANSFLGYIYIYILPVLTSFISCFYPQSSDICLTSCTPSPVKTLFTRLRRRKRDTHRSSAGIFEVIYFAVVRAVTKTCTFHSKDLDLCNVSHNEH